MKSIMVCVILFSVACVQAQSITVEANQKLNTDFSKYKTFDWASQVDSELDEGLYFLNDLVLKADVREAVQGEMEGLGYQKQDNNADLIVNFRVFDQGTRLKGYEGYGTSYWGNNEYRSADDTTSYAVEPGTLIISLLDRKEGTLVWQGFASGLINNNQFIKDEAKIKEAVNLIFEEYDYRANEYSKR